MRVYVRRIFLPKEVTGKWRKELNEELHNLYPSSYNIRTIRSKRKRDWRDV
jgi:hypothetical protein